jgi:hypothetical protein
MEHIKYFTACQLYFKEIIRITNLQDTIDMFEYKNKNKNLFLGGLCVDKFSPYQKLTFWMKKIHIIESKYK